MIPDNPLFQDGTLDRITFDGTLTKRERFAMAAMQGLCANTHSVEWAEQTITQLARRQADYLIAELNSTHEPE